MHMAHSLSDAPTRPWRPDSIGLAFPCPFASDPGVSHPEVDGGDRCRHAAGCARGRGDSRESWGCNFVVCSFGKEGPVLTTALLGIGMPGPGVAPG